MKIELHNGGDDWSALYVDGNLHTGPCDTYLCDEALRAMLGVVMVDDDAFMLGQNNRDGAAKTTAEIDVYVDQRAANLAEARRLKQEAEALLARARSLDPHGRNI